jgi:hypothetical protein
MTDAATADGSGVGAFLVSGDRDFLLRNSGEKVPSFPSLPPPFLAANLCGFGCVCTIFLAR